MISESYENIEKVETLISEINRIHKEFSDYYFSKMNITFNLKKNINHVPVEYIYKYRLNLHENINDYLCKANKLNKINYFYRVKTKESIDDKINRFSCDNNLFPVCNWLNDIFGARIILNQYEINIILDYLDEWKNKYGLKNWYKRDKDEYRGIYLYFNNGDNTFFPWELQIWDINDVDDNINSHIKYKRNWI